jgi:hypothetical protein
MSMRLAIGVFLLAAASAALAEPHRRATVTLSSGAITINVPAGGPNPANSTDVTLSTSGGKVDWSIPTPAQSWLSVTPTAGTLNPNGSVTLQVRANVLSPVLLAPGSYPGQITVNATNNPGGGAATGSPLHLNVTLNVSSSAVIAVSPGELDFAAPTNVTPAAKTFTVTNQGGSPLNWTMTTNKPWLHVNPTGGSNLAPGATSAPITVSVDAQSAPMNDTTGSVSVKENGTAQTQSVIVTYVVSSAPHIQLLPTSLSFDAASGGPDPAPQFLALTNTGGQDLNWSVSVSMLSGSGWLSVDPPLSGTLTGGSPTSLTVRISNKPGGTFLAPGTYQGSVTVNGQAGVTAQSSNITLNVNADPTISLNPTDLSFRVSVDNPVSSPIGVAVQNTGSGQLGWSYTDGPPWISVSPSSGTLGIFGSQSIVVQVNASGMSPGLYTGTITIAGVNESVPAPFPSASNSPQTVSLTLIVDSSTLPTHAPAGQCGLSGLEGLLPVLAFLLRRRFAKRGETV